jgi:hypothetical protein
MSVVESLRMNPLRGVHRSVAMNLLMKTRWFWEYFKMGAMARASKAL